MSRLSRRSRTRRALLALLAALSITVTIIPVVEAVAPARDLTVSPPEVVVGAARLFTFTYTGNSTSTATLTLPPAFSDPSTGSDRSTGTIRGVGWVQAGNGMSITGISGRTITLHLAPGGTLRYFGRTNATGRNQILFSRDGRTRTVAIWGRAAKISVAVNPEKRVASTTGTMAATALVTDVNGVVQPNVVLYFKTTLPGGTVITSEADGVAGCSSSSVDGAVCTGANGTAGVTFRTGTTAGCFKAIAQNRAWPSSYNGSGAFQVWPDVWVRDSAHVRLLGSQAWLPSGTSRDVMVAGYDKWGNTANLTSGDGAWLEKSSGTGTVHIGAAEYGAGSCWGAPAEFEVTGETAGTIVLRGGLLRTATPKLYAQNVRSFYVVPGNAAVVEVTTGTSDRNEIHFDASGDTQVVRVSGRDAFGNRICFKTSGDYDANRNVHLSVSSGDDTTGVSFQLDGTSGTCTWSWLNAAGYGSTRNVTVTSWTDGTDYPEIRLYGYVDGTKSSTGTHWPYITVSWGADE